MYFVIVTSRANKTSIVSITPIHKSVLVRFSLRIGFEMEQAITARFLEICREHVKIPKLLVLNEDGAMTEEELAQFRDQKFHTANPEYYMEAIRSQGGVWDWCDGGAKCGSFSSSTRLVATLEDVHAFEHCDNNIAQIPAIEVRLLKRAIKLMVVAACYSRYANIVMLAPRYDTCTSADYEEAYCNIYADIEYRVIAGNEETDDEEEVVRHATQMHWLGMGDELD